MIRVVPLLLLLVFVAACASTDGPPAAAPPAAPAASPPADAVAFPAPVDTLVADEFTRCEGIAFNGEGTLFVAGDKALWRVASDGSAERLGTYFSNLGLAAYGERDVLFADFGRFSAFDGNPVRDGIVWRVTPEGKRTRVVKKGIVDPNFIVVREDGSFLVSDDSTNEIWHVTAEGELTLFSDAVQCPNGMVLSPDGRTLYVAQIFKSIGPVVWDDRIWKLPLDETGWPSGEPELLVATGEGHDGLAMDVHGRVYTASNHTNQILRIDPETGEVVVICENVPGVASLAFGQGEFDRRAIYGTTMRAGIVFSVHVGVEGYPLVH